MAIEISVNKSGGCPAFNGAFARINVILGTNGTGKSKLLGQVANQLRKSKQEYVVVHTLGGRTISLKQRFTKSTGNNFRKVEVSDGLETLWREGYLRSGRSDPANRVTRSLDNLTALLLSAEMEYRMKLIQWADSDREVGAPERQEIPIQGMLDSFSKVFPNICLRVADFKYLNDDRGWVSSVDFNLECEKDGEIYGVQNMSDGEKQVFCTLVEGYLLSESKCIFVIDEPELNLDPMLGERWQS